MAFSYYDYQGKINRAKRFRRDLYKREEAYPNLILGTLDFNLYGRHFFSLNCKLNLTYEKKYEAIYDPVERKWIIFDEDGERTNKSIGFIFRKFNAECKKESIW